MRALFALAGALILGLVAWFFLYGPQQSPTKAGGAAGKDPGEVNVYSARHYDGDRALFRAFEAKTGIRVNIFEASAEQLIERLKAEGADSPADLIITVDAGNLWRAQEAGLFQAWQAADLEAALPAHLRQKDGYWFALTKRARIIAYDTRKFSTPPIHDYSELADPKWRGQICVRSSSNVYNLSLMSALIARWGEIDAQAWAKGVVANFARSPQGGDIDQLKALGAGLCPLAIVNHYYAVRLETSADPAEQALSKEIGLIFPDADGVGTHINVSGAGIAKTAKNLANAQALLRFLLEPAEQQAISASNSEFPARNGVEPASSRLKSLAGFKEDPLPLDVLGINQAQAQEIYDKAEWK